MKVALVYTSTTPELIELVEKEVGDVLPRETEVASYQDPSILAEVRDAGYVTAPPAARLVGMYMTAVSEGADAILNLCSSVGEVADAAQDIARYTGIPIVRVDEEMCRGGSKAGKKNRGYGNPSHYTESHKEHYFKGCQGDEPSGGAGGRAGGWRLRPGPGTV